MKTLELYLQQAMPQHYPGKVSYQKDSKFTPISIRNIHDYAVLGQCEEFLYLVHPEQTAGFVFLIDDLHANHHQILPVMRLSLRDVGQKYPQAHYLRIRQSFSMMNIASTWYRLYVDQFGGIVSDNEHLEGGKQLWASFIKVATNDPAYRVTMLDMQTGERIESITTATPESAIWSHDASKKSTILMFQRSNECGGDAQDATRSAP